MPSTRVRYAAARANFATAFSFLPKTSGFMNATNDDLCTNRWINAPNKRAVAHVGFKVPPAECRLFNVTLLGDGISAQIR